MEDQSVSSSSYICTWWVYVCSDDFQVLLSCGNWQSFDFFVQSGKIWVIWVSEFRIKGRGKSLWETHRIPVPYVPCMDLQVTVLSTRKEFCYPVLHPSPISTTSIRPFTNFNPDYWKGRFSSASPSQDRLTRAQRPRRSSLPAETTLDQFISSWHVDRYNSVSHLSWGQLCLAQSNRIS